MFNWLAKYNQVLVTGPQRSGTRICAQMIAVDAGFFYIDEIDFGIDSLYKLTALLAQARRVVVQCPALCRYVHYLAHEQMAVVLMRRDVDAIANSQQRINWAYDQVELMRYDQNEGSIAQVKYDFWETHQIHHIPHAFEISYESLQRHPLWVPSQLRHQFAAGQINVHQADSMYFYHGPDVTSIPINDRPTHLCLQRRSATYELNEVGMMIWNLCNGMRTEADIIQDIFTQFSDDVSLTQLEADVSTFINALLNAECLRVSLNRFEVALPCRTT